MFENTKNTCFGVCRSLLVRYFPTGCTFSSVYCLMLFGSEGILVISVNKK